MKYVAPYLAHHAIPYHTTFCGAIPYLTIPYKATQTPIFCVLGRQVLYRRPCVGATKQQSGARRAHPEEDRRQAFPVVHFNWKREVGSGAASRGEGERCG